MGLKRIPHDWPPADEAQAAERARWVEEYAARCQGHDACRLVQELGRGNALPEADRVRELHDRKAISFAGRPLA